MPPTAEPAHDRPSQGVPVNAIPALERPSAGWIDDREKVLISLARGVAILVFACIVPAGLLFQAHKSTSGMIEVLSSQSRMSAMLQALPPSVQALKSPADYALYTTVFVEMSNQSVMLNKQYLKTATIQIGFAICSIGLLMLLLGFSASGVSASVGNSGSPVYNLKIASGGVAIFVLGAGIAAAAGILKNEYTTVSMPNYLATSSHGRTGQDATHRDELAKEIAARASACFKNMPEEKAKELCTSQAASAVLSTLQR
jgi:hypothetical protein